MDLTQSHSESHMPHRCPAHGPGGIRAALCCTLLAALVGCASPPPAMPPSGSLLMPLRQGWFDGEVVYYVTTDVSDAQMAQRQQANHAPRLSASLPQGPVRPGSASAVDTVYAVTNFQQISVFASAPLPVGPANRDRAYSPLWRLVTVTWLGGHSPRRLTSEEQILAAQELGAVRLDTTDVVLNCPIVHRGTRGGLDGVTIPAVTR